MAKQGVLCRLEAEVIDKEVELMEAPSRSQFVLVVTQQTGQHGKAGLLQGISFTAGWRAIKSLAF